MQYLPKQYMCQTLRLVPTATTCLQAMDGSLTEASRQHCADAARPLLQAVETLTTFAASPEFACVPATISAKVIDFLLFCGCGV